LHIVVLMGGEYRWRICNLLGVSGFWMLLDASVVIVVVGLYFDAGCLNGLCWHVVTVCGFSTSSESCMYNTNANAPKASFFVMLPIMPMLSTMPITIFLKTANNNNNANAQVLVSFLAPTMTMAERTRCL